MEPTCNSALAGIASGQGSDAVRGVWDFVAAILNEDGVAASHVRHIGHQVGSILVVPNVGLLGFPFWVLQVRRLKM